MSQTSNINNVLPLKHHHTVISLSYKNANSTEMLNIIVELAQLYTQFSMEMKRLFLFELLKYIKNDNVTKQWLIDKRIITIIQTITTSLFRSFPETSTNTQQLEDPHWSTFELIYDILQEFVNNASFQTLQTYIDKSFLSNLIRLFNSPNPFERECLKQILHSIYRRCHCFRKDIRKSINNYFYCMIYSNEEYNAYVYGISDLLQILSCIINGFIIPLKRENILLLTHVFIPMHKVSFKFLSLFHKQLVYCVLQFIHRDPSLGNIIISGLLKYWPMCSSEKELLFLDELEQILNIINIKYIHNIMIPLFNQLTKSMSAAHFSVSQNALLIWTSKKMLQFISENKQEILPILYPVLENNCTDHWHEMIRAATLNMKKMLNKWDPKLFKDILANYVKHQKMVMKKKGENASKWRLIHEMAFEKKK